MNNNPDLDLDLALGRIRDTDQPFGSFNFGYSTKKKIQNAVKSST